MTRVVLTVVLQIVFASFAYGQTEDELFDLAAQYVKVEPEDAEKVIKKLRPYSLENLNVIVDKYTLNLTLMNLPKEKATKVRNVLELTQQLAITELKNAVLLLKCQCGIAAHERVFGSKEESLKLIQVAIENCGSYDSPTCFLFEGVANEGYGHLCHLLGAATEADEWLEKAWILLRDKCEGKKPALTRQYEFMYLYNKFGLEHEDEDFLKPIFQLCESEEYLVGDRAGLISLVVNFYSRNGDLKKADSWCEKFHNLAAANPADAELLCQMNHSRGTVECLKGNGEQAVKYYKASMKGVAPHYLVDCYNSLGTAYSLLKDHVEALKQFQVAEEYASKHLPMRIPQILCNKGLAYIYLAIDTSGEDRTEFLEKAKQELIAAKKISEGRTDRRDIYFVDGDLAYVYHLLGKSEKSLELLDPVIKTAKELSDLGNLWSYQAIEAEAYLGLGKIDDAIASLKSSIETIEEINRTEAKDVAERLYYFKEKKQPYVMLASILIEKGEGLEALRYADASKGRVLRRIFSSKPKQRHYESDWGTEFLKESCGEQTCIVQFVIGDKEVLVFTILPGGVVKSQALKVTPVELKKLAREFSVRVSQKGRGFESSAKSLYELILSPIERDLAGTKKIVFIPDDFLWEVPFPAIMDSDGNFLIEKHTISTAFSLSVLKIQSELAGAREAQNKSSQFTLVTNPLRTDKEALKGVETNRKQLAKLHKSNLVALDGPDATREKFAKAVSDSYVIHFGGHAAFNNKRPFVSRLLLANNDEFHMADLFETRTKARLVLLPACSTGRGSDFPGEGSIGFAWAWSQAGCPTLVVCDWVVDDAATSAILNKYHALAKKDNYSLNADHLCNSIVSYLKENDRPHPYFWAGVRLIGYEK